MVVFLRNAALSLGLSTLAFTTTAQPATQSLTLAQNQDITISVAPRLGRSGIGRELSNQLEDALPRNVDIARNLRRANFIIEVEERYFNTDLRVRNKRPQWTNDISSQNRDDRIGWVEVNAEARVEYNYTISVTEQTSGRIIHQDRYNGRDKAYLRWGEDLKRVSDGREQSYNRYPSSQVRTLFACAPQNGHDPFVDMKGVMTQNLANKIAVIATSIQRQYGNGSRGAGRARYRGRGGADCR